MQSIFRTIVGTTKGMTVLKQIRRRCYRCQKRAVAIERGEAVCRTHSKEVK